MGKAAGLDLPSLLQKIPPSLLEGVLGAIPINLGGVLLDAAGPILTPGLLSALARRRLALPTPAAHDTDQSRSDSSAWTLSDPLNLSNLDLPGVKLITTGPPLHIVETARLDLGWVPIPEFGCQRDQQHDVPRHRRSWHLVKTLIDRLQGNVDLPLGNIIANPLGLPINLPVNLPVNIPVEDLLSALNKIVDNLPVDIDVAKVRVPIVVGFGMGAFMRLVRPTSRWSISCRTSRAARNRRQRPLTRCSAASQCCQ